MKEPEDYFAGWDPMGFVKDLGVPKDEYALEATEIAKAYRNSMSEDEVAELVYRTFVELIELDHPEFKNETLARAKDIKSILDK